MADLGEMQVLTGELHSALIPELPDAMEAPFDVLDERVALPLQHLWESQERWLPHAKECAPQWVFPLRVIACYLNMSEAFFGCGEDFLVASQDEDAFVARHKERPNGDTIFDVASHLLARIVLMLRDLGFEESVVGIGADLFYYGSCPETEKWRQEFDEERGTDTRKETMAKRDSGHAEAETRHYLEALLDTSVSVEEKAEELAEFVRRWELIGKSTGIGVRGGRRFAYEQLFKAIPSAKKREQLKQILEEIDRYCGDLKEVASGAKKSIAEMLRSLKSGTPVVIKNRGREDLVCLVEVKRTRFTYEYPDGRRYRVPVDNFVKAAPRRRFRRLSEKERQQRELVRALGGSRFNVARDKLLEQGVDALKSMLDELASSLERIENAPVGFSEGMLGLSLGPVRKVSTRDEALAKRIPQVIREVAKRAGADKIRRRVQRYPVIEVRSRCRAVLDKLKK